MTAIEYARFDWPKASVTILGDPTQTPTLKNVEVVYDGTTVRLLSMADSSDLVAPLVVPADDDGIRRVVRVDRDHFDLIGEDGRTFQVYKGCGCG